jgi:hypothetical protein
LTVWEVTIHALWVELADRAARAASVGTALPALAAAAMAVRMLEVRPVGSVAWRLR